jgi:hypothetical protein
LNGARVALLRITDLPGFVDFLAGSTDIGGGRCPNPVLLWNEVSPRPRLSHFAPSLRGVIFVGKPAVSYFSAQKTVWLASG